MNRNPYITTLNNALNEVKNAYPEINHSFIFSQDGTILSEDPETSKENIQRTIDSFEALKEKADAIGELQGVQINGKDGKLILSIIKDKFLVLETSKKADKTHVYAITHVIIPTLLKTLGNIDTNPITTPFTLTSTKELAVNTFSGLFAGDSVQIDAETLVEWAKNNDSPSEQKIEEILQVRIETSGGNTTLYPVKKISDVRRRGKNLIRIPDKLCKTLKVKEGELVKVKPAQHRRT
jgi:predicted regulator of Ras-like GTPase activity (Roadblock/LC7/MglB family)